MADMLAIDWEKGQLGCIEADVSKGHATLKRCFVLNWPEDVEPGTRPQQAGQWLKAELRRLGVTARQAVVAVAREDAMVRHLELPNVPDNEMPDLVRFQAATKSAQPLDKLLLDYLPLPPRTSFEGRDVLLTTIPASLSETIRTVLQEAGLEFMALGIASFATSELVARAQQQAGHDPQSYALVLSQHGHRVEISVMQGTQLLSSHSTQLLDGTGEQLRQALFAQINRLLVALQKVIGHVSMAHVWLIGSEEDCRPHLEACAERFGCPASVIDPLTVPGVRLAAREIAGARAAYGAPVGMLLAQGASHVATVDFLHPRRPVVAKDWKQWRPAMIAAALILVLAGGYMIRRQYVSELAGEIAALQQQDLDLTGILDDGQPTLDSSKVLQDWQDSNVVWLAPMSRMAEAMPGTDRLYLTDWTFNKLPGTNSVGQIRATIRAKDRNDVYQLRDQLAALGMTPIPSTILDDNRDPLYPYRSALEINLRPQTPPKAADAATATAGRPGNRGENS